MITVLALALGLGAATGASADADGCEPFIEELNAVQAESDAHIAEEGSVDKSNSAAVDTYNAQSEDINARGYAAQAAARACASGVNVRPLDAQKTPISYDGRQVQAKFKHAADFGVQGNYNSANAQAYQAKMDDLLASRATITIDGNYRGQGPAVFNVQPSTNLFVMQQPNGVFWDAYKLSPAQMQGILEKGFLW